MNKFTENNFEKLQRLFELHTTSREKLLAADEAREEAVANVAEDLVLTESDLYLQRCEDGLSALQNTDFIILRLANAGNRQLLDAVKSLFAIQGVKKSEVREVVEEYSKNMPTAKEELETQLKNILQ